jgi:hypothetical protein
MREDALAHGGVMGSPGDRRRVQTAMPALPGQSACGWGVGVTGTGTRGIAGVGPNGICLRSNSAGPDLWEGERDYQMHGKDLCCSAARLTSWVPWLCVPGSRRVCLYR